MYANGRKCMQMDEHGAVCMQPVSKIRPRRARLRPQGFVKTLRSGFPPLSVCHVNEKSMESQESVNKFQEILG